MTFILTPGMLTLADCKRLLASNEPISLSPSSHQTIHAADQVVKNILQTDRRVYGINTGFGLLANQRIHAHELEKLQRNIVLSHAAGVGNDLSDVIVKLILLLKINSLARGYSGVRLSTIETLIAIYNANIIPCIPEKGSVGASGDLAPLAHLSMALIGEGHAKVNGKRLPALQALQQAGISPVTLSAKEGLALLNGTQVSTALALYGLMMAETILFSALIAGAMSVDAAKGSDTPFDERIHEVRGQPGQIKVAALLRELLHHSEIRHAHRDCHKIQDPYSLRCQPQVMGACMQLLTQCKEVLSIEMNAVTDNPLIFTDTADILSGGNFHAEPVAFAADQIALALAEMGSLSERRIALLVDPHFSGLPGFLVPEPGINSGFMIAQVTAAALVSENKALAYPVSVDSIPTSANQEDHVSMATYAARRLQQMVENVSHIIAIELLAACQGLDFLKPLQTSPKLMKVYDIIRAEIPFYSEDRYIAPDIAFVNQLLSCGKIAEIITD